MNFYTADSHFSTSDDSVISRDFRPFDSLGSMNEAIIKIWNEQSNEEDVIYHLGDFVNYNWIDLDYENRLKLVEKIKAKVILILGNNEKRIMLNEFGGNFEKFKKYLLKLGFFGVYENELSLKIGENVFKLVHQPIDADKESEYNLFGHIHRCALVKRYGFNVGVDNHNYKLFSEDEILELCSRRNVFDENIYS